MSLLLADWLAGPAAGSGLAAGGACLHGLHVCQVLKQHFVNFSLLPALQRQFSMKVLVYAK